MKPVRNRRTYSEEFKSEAVRLCAGGERSQSSVAESLGITQVMLSRWVRESKSKSTSQVNASKKSEVIEAQAAEIRRLEADVKRLQMEQDILKKAASYFAKHLA